MALQDFAVKFGRDVSMGREGANAFPFIYSFVNTNDVPFTPVAAGVQPSLDTIAKLVPASDKLDFNIMLDPDYNYKIIAIRYTVYHYIARQLPGLTQYEWYFNSPALVPGMSPEAFKGTPLTSFISVSLFCQGSDSACQFGGMQAGFGTQSLIPLPLTATQGYDSGFYTVRTTRLIARQSILALTLNNSHTEPLYVGGAIYGMKIRL